MNDSSGIAVVTGAGAGARPRDRGALRREGWRVGLLSRDASGSTTPQREIERRRRRGARAARPTSPTAGAVFAARDRGRREWGTIDAWVNCAMATVVGPVAKMTRRGIPARRPK